MTPLPITTFSFSAVMHLFFWVVIVTTTVVSVSMYYHWSRFSLSHSGAVITITSYTIGLAVLVLALTGVLATI